jgi:hypothetical protein
MARVRIGKMVLEFDSDDELDRFVARHAGQAESDAEPVSGGGNGGGGRGTTPSGGDRDRSLLQQFLRGGDTGIPAATVAGLLDGAVGRGVAPALARWAVRVRLAASEDNQAVVVARPGGKRGWKLSPSGLSAARALHGEGGPTAS